MRSEKTYSSLDYSPKKNGIDQEMFSWQNTKQKSMEIGNCKRQKSKLAGNYKAKHHELAIIQKAAKPS